VQLALFLLLWLAASAAEAQQASSAVSAVVETSEQGILLNLINQSRKQAGSPDVVETSEQGFLLNLINQSRKQAGSPAVAWDDKLAHAALDHATVMAQKGSLSHQFAGEPSLLERLVACQVRFDYASENVVYDLTLQGGNDSFMSSTPHRANLLDPKFDEVGIAVVKAGGLLYIVEDFAHHVADVQDDEQAAHIIVVRFNAFRRNTGGHDLLFTSDPRLHRMAQAMAKRETLDSGPASALPGARFAASYATANPTQVPPSVVCLAGKSGLSHFSVGVSYAQTPKYPTGMYWVSIALF
jgi:uncharacterized protein YkwD